MNHMSAVADTLVPLIVAFQQMHDCIQICYLFGSHAKGNATAESDIDIAVLLQDGADPVVDLLLADYLAEKLGKKIDIVVLNRASSILQHEVVRDGIRLLEASPMVRRLFELRSFRGYVDAVFFQRKRNMRLSHG